MHNHIHEFEGLGTQRKIVYFFDERISGIEEKVQRFDDRYSRFKSTSVLSQLNKERHLSESDDQLKEMLKLGKNMENDSGAYFSLFVGGILESLGYGKHEGELGESIEPSSIIREKDMIRLTGNQQLDLGGLGKGYLIGKLEDYLKENGVEEYYIDGGGDIAISQTSKDIFGRIGIQDPNNESLIIDEVTIINGSLANSGKNIRRRKNEQGEINHHLIDSQTGKSKETPLLSVHVFHPKAVVADMLATTFFVLPLQNVNELAKKYAVEFLLVFDDMSVLKSRGRKKTH